MSENEIKVIKSPIAPMPKVDETLTAVENNVVYYVRLNNGIVVTRPEDFPNGAEAETTVETEHPTD